jgi:cysteine synthase B
MPVASPGFLRAARSIVDLIGNTPLIRLSGFEGGLRNVELYAKAEWKNPGGSVKDRAAARMIAEGERSGALTRDKIILDATSGNTGIAYAMIGAAKGYRVRLCVPENVTPERKRILKAFGAEVIFTDPMQGSDGAIIRVKQMYEESPGLYFYPDQYNNPGNWRAHYDTTAPGLARAVRSSAWGGGFVSTTPPSA